MVTKVGSRVVERVVVVILLVVEGDVVRGGVVCSSFPWKDFCRQTLQVEQGVKQKPTKP